MLCIQCQRLFLQEQSIFVHAYTFLSVRLALPQPWLKRMSSDLPRFTTLLLAGITSIIVLPMLLSKQRHRKLLSTSSTWRTSYHILSGNARKSLLGTSHQGVVILSIGGVVCLLLQYPVNVLKGEVVSSTQESRVQRFHCPVRPCTLLRADATDGLSVLSGHFGVGIRSLPYTIENKRKKLCSVPAYSTNGMPRLTKLLALLEQHALCLEPEFLRSELARLSPKLVFEFWTDSETSQSMCSPGESEEGQVFLEKHLQVTTRILEHGLLRHTMLKSLLYSKHSDQERFWEKRMDDRNTKLADQFRKDMKETVADLENKYSKFHMSAESRDLIIFGFGKTVAEIRAAFLCTSLIIIASFALSRFSKEFFSEMW